MLRISFPAWKYLRLSFFIFPPSSALHFLSRSLQNASAAFAALRREFLHCRLQRRSADIVWCCLIIRIPFFAIFVFSLILRCLYRSFCHFFCGSSWSAGDGNSDVSPPLFLLRPTKNRVLQQSKSLQKRHIKRLDICSKLCYNIQGKFKTANEFAGYMRVWRNWQTR